MNEISFEWDENKNTINKDKHGVSFEEARTVFYDEDALVIVDEMFRKAKKKPSAVMVFSKEEQQKITRMALLSSRFSTTCTSSRNKSS